MPVYRDRRGRYTVDFRLQGRRVFRRCPEGATLAQARAYEARLRAERIADKLEGRKPTVSLAAALQHYIETSIKGTRSEGKAEAAVYRLAEHVEGRSVADAPAVAVAFRSASSRLSVASINRSLAALRRACRLAYEAGQCHEPVHLKIKTLAGETKRTVWLTPEEVDRLVACAKYQRTKDMILILAYTGLRFSELLSLRPEDVRGGIIHVRTGKTGEMRSIPVHPRIKSAVKRLPIEGSRRTIQQSWEWARKKAGMQHVHLHDLRHTFGSWLAQKGTSLPVIMALMGHKAAQTAMRYLHLDQRAKREAVGKI